MVVKDFLNWCIKTNNKINIQDIDKILNSGLLKKKWHFAEYIKIDWYIIKIFQNINLTSDELDRLYNWYIKYRKNLDLLGIRIPKWFIADKYEDRKILLFVDELIIDWKYLDFEDKLLRENDNILLLNDCTKILNHLIKIWENKLNIKKTNSLFLNCWVDFKHWNIHFDSNWDLYLFDLFVPKIREKNWEILYIEKIHRLSREVLDFIHFNKIWIIYWFYYKIKTLLEWKKDELVNSLKNIVIIEILNIFNWDIKEAKKYIEILDTNYRELSIDILLNDYI